MLAANCERVEERGNTGQLTQGILALKIQLHLH
jgi:hypothetical protein